MPPQYRTRTRRGVVKEVGALNPATLGGSRWRGRSVCSRLASHFVRTTSARTPSSPLTTCCYSCCFGPEKSLYHISTPPSPSLLPYFFLIRSLSRASLGPFFLFPSSSSCCKLGCLPPPTHLLYSYPSPSRPVNLAQPCPAPPWVNTIRLFALASNRHLPAAHADWRKGALECQSYANYTRRYNYNLFSL